MHRRAINPRTLLALVMALALLGSLMPWRWTAWAGWFRGPLMTIVAPVSTPLAWLSSWLRPGESRRGADDAEAAELRLQLEFYRVEYLRAEQQVEQLKQVVEALQGGVPFGPGRRLRRLHAARAGADLGAGTIDVARGSVHGVTADTVAVAAAAPQHLVGIVSRIGPTISTIRLITDPRLAPALIDAMLIPAGEVSQEAIARAPRCQFAPLGDGSLAGDLGVNEASRVSRGDAALLDDPSWPPGAQRLILGRVVRLEDTRNPLFKRLVIRPDVDPARVRSVVLCIPEPAERGTGR